MTLQIKITEEKSKYVILDLQNGFDPTFMLSLLRLEGTAKPNTCQRKMLGRNHPQVVEEEVRWFLWIHQTLPSLT